MADNPNNPAGRLLYICRKLSSINNSIGLKEAWAKVVDVPVPVEDTPLLLDRIGASISLIEYTKKAIYSLDDIDRNLFLKWEQPVANAFSQLNLSGSNVAQIKQFLTPEIIISLEYCDHELARRNPEQTLDPNELQKVIEEIKSLIDEVVQSNLPDEIRSFILDKLDLLLRSLELYKFCGITPITTAIDAILGATVRCKGNPYTDSKDDPSGKKFWAICSKVSTLIALAGGGKKLLEECINRLIG